MDPLWISQLTMVAWEDGWARATDINAPWRDLLCEWGEESVQGQINGLYASALQQKWNAVLVAQRTQSNYVNNGCLKWSNSRVMYRSPQMKRKWGDASLTSTKAFPFPVYPSTAAIAALQLMLFCCTKRWWHTVHFDCNWASSLSVCLWFHR